MDELEEFLKRAAEKRQARKGRRRACPRLNGRKN